MAQRRERSADVLGVVALVVRHRLGGLDAGARHRQQRVDADAVLAALERERLGEPVDARLGGRVVALRLHCEEPAGRAGHHHPALARAAQRRPGRARHEEAAAQMDVEHRVEVLRCELLDVGVAHEAGVVDERVEAAEAIERRGHDRLGAGGRRDRLVARERAAARGLDLAGHGARVLAREVVHDHRRAAARKLDGVGAAEPAARAGDHGHLPVERERRAHSNSRSTISQTQTGRSPPSRSPVTATRHS